MPVQPSRRTRRLAAALACLALLHAGAASAQNGAPQGVVTKPAKGEFRPTVQALAGAIEAKGLTLFATIDHAAGAEGAGLALRPTTLLIFGNPKAGTPLMQASQLVGLELPQKMLVWQDQAGRVMLSYNDPADTARRFGLDPAKPPVPVIAATLAALADAAAAP